MKLLIASFVIFISAFTSPCLAQSSNAKFTIVKETPVERLSRNNLYIRLNEKTDKETLTSIAHDLRKDRKQYDRLWIFYFLPGMDVEAGNGCWATTHFTPEHGLEVDIIGSTATEDKKTGSTDNIKGEILGKWRSENSLMGATLVMYKTSGNETINRSKIDFKSMSRSKEVVTIPEGALVMQTTHTDGSQSKEVLAGSEVNGKKRYDYGNNHGEYYQLEANGNLGLYGRDGKFDEAIKIK
jgi:hypothetical protein